MNTSTRQLALRGAYLLQGTALAMAASPAIAKEARESLQTQGQGRSVQAADEIEIRINEAAHLNVPGSCKWGHAAFEPVEVVAERLSAEAKAIYLMMDVA